MDFNGKVYTKNDVLQILKDLGADKAKVLYVHTDIGFAKPLLKRREFLENIFSVLTELGVKSLIFPTYTFSFCNGEIYDVKNSKTPMGMLNEYARNVEGAFRTNDPLMSVCVIGEVPDRLRSLSNLSCGKNGAFEIMRNDDEHMFLFFGAKPTECFTFLHYVESIYGVPYRYDREFSGIVVNEAGNKSEQTYILPTLYDSVIPQVKSTFEDRLLAKGILKKAKLGDKWVMLVKGKSVFDETIKCLDEDINVLLARPYDAFSLGTSYNHKNVKSLK